MSQIKEVVRTHPITGERYISYVTASPEDMTARLRSHISQEIAEHGIEYFKDISEDLEDIVAHFLG